MYLLQILQKERKIYVKKTLVIILALSFIFVGLGNSQLKAQYGFIGEGLPYGASGFISSLMLTDWQSDYLMPIEPAELKKGDYRIYGNAANFSTLWKERRFLEDTLSESDVSIMNYFVGFDTALRDDIYFHINYDISPWQEYDNDYNRGKTKFQLLNMFLDYEIDKDKRLYFGYTKNKFSEKEYDSETEEFYLDDEQDINIIYVGFEMRGSFSK